MLGADLWLDESYDSGFDNCRGARFVLDLHQPAILSDSVSDASGEILSEQATELTSSNEECKDVLPKSLHVLFTDDDMILRRMFVRSLKRTCPGWIISESSNGETALRMAQSAKFDVIFMDHYVSTVPPKRNIQQISSYPSDLLFDFLRWLHIHNNCLVPKLSERSAPWVSNHSYVG
jgi:hypothetical protein